MICSCFHVATVLVCAVLVGIHMVLNVVQVDRMQFCLLVVVHTCLVVPQNTRIHYVCTLLNDTIP